MFSLREIEQQVEELARKIDAPLEGGPTYGTSKDEGTPYVEIYNSNYCFLARERDTTTLDQRTQDIDELLYWVFEYITHKMASSYAVVHRVSIYHHRRVMFSRQLDLLEELNPLWRKRREKEIDNILRLSPDRES